MSDSVTLTIDGTEVTVPKGTKVIEAAKKLGKKIPHFCYHPGLPVDGNCRMCTQGRFATDSRQTCSR